MPTFTYLTGTEFDTPEPTVDMSYMEEDEDVFCADDVKECGDGEFVMRDPSDNCNFPDCPGLGCADDVFECPDRSYVSRDPGNNCEYEPCSEETVACTDDVFPCDDGSFVPRDPTNDCNFRPCPSGDESDEGSSFPDDKAPSSTASTSTATTSSACTVAKSNRTISGILIALVAIRISCY